MSQLLKQIGDLLGPICARADEVLEYSDQLTIDGQVYPELKGDIERLFQFQQDNDVVQPITVRLNGEAIDANLLVESLAEDVQAGTWQVLIAKDALTEKDQVSRNVHTIWFLTEASFQKWISALDSFGPSGAVFRKFHATRILVEGIDQAFGGPLLAVDDVDAAKIPDGWPFDYEGPDENAIKRQVHLLASGGTSLCPAPFLLSWGDIDGDVAKAFRVLSAKSIATCLTQEYYDSDRVVLKGARRLEIPLSVSGDTAPRAADLAALWDAVRWVYDERPEVRAGLIADRLSLDLSDGISLVSGAARFIRDALTQSKEQYRFVIQERKDAYAKELREILKDVQHQAGLFSEKTRSIMNSLLRDVLAALLLISLGLFSRVGKSHDVLASNEARMLFRALSVYLVISLVLQLFVHLRDLHLANKELAYWANTTRTQLGVDEINKHLKDPIADRRNSFYWLAALLSLVYVALVAAAWNFQCILKVLGVL